jgi:malonyl-CoA decarboxylase
MAQTATQRSWLDRLWAGIADQGRAFIRVPAADTAPIERAGQLFSALLSERGEASGAAIAREVVHCLRAMAAPERLQVMHFLSERFSPEPAALQAAAEAYLASADAANASRLHRLAEPPRQELLRRMNMAPGGTAMLIELRREVQAHLRSDTALHPLDQDLLHLFSSWFNRGFLELRRIDWDTSAAVLEKLIVYEAVHEIDGWQDLRRRLLPDRRCFAFFHQALPNEPLIFVEVALTTGLADAVQPLLAPPADGAGRPAKTADSAIFYSISNCQEGLRGISFGNFLIKQVVEELKAELPQLKTFATLSPVPGFRDWLEKRWENGSLAVSEEEGLALRALDHAPDPQVHDRWWRDTVRAAAVRAPLLRLAATYLLRNAATDGKIDPVARFHLGNGARLERINWLGNISRRGMRESYGIMVNYLYDPGKIEANHEAFINTGRVARSAEVEALAIPRRNT